VSVLTEFINRRRARRWQRWTETAPEDDVLRRARIITTIFVGVMLLLLVGIVVAVIVALA
jgi:hypothetical protein